MEYKGWPSFMSFRRKQGVSMVCNNDFNNGLLLIGKHGNVKCPECECNEVHLSFCKVDQGKTSALVTCESTQVVPVEKPASRRGSRILIGFFCESGCQKTFTYSFTFHEGMTFFEAASVGRQSEPGELWRD
jgi:hypothetical protein